LPRILTCCATLAASLSPTKARDTRLIQGYLGHRKIEHTVKYTATNPAHFERLWR
jgi:site-specific recombinase XerD